MSKKTLVQKWFDSFTDSLLATKSANLLAKFDRTVIKLRKLSDIAAERIATKTEEITTAETDATKAIGKAKVKETKAIVKAEMKRFDRVTKAENTKVKTVATKNTEINVLNEIVKRNNRVAEKLEALTA